jgi:hypothetical protein
LLAVSDPRREVEQFDLCLRCRPTGACYRVRDARTLLQAVEPGPPDSADHIDEQRRRTGVTCVRSHAHRRRDRRARRSQQQFAENDEQQQRNDTCNKSAPPVEWDLGHVANRGDSGVTDPGRLCAESVPFD